MPVQVPTPIARWVQMAALGAPICNAFNQVVGSIMSVSKPCQAWRPLPSNRAGKTAGTLKPSHIWCDAWFLCFLRQVPRSYNSTFPPTSQCEKSYWLLHTYVQQLNVCILMKYHKIFIFSFNLSHDDCLTTTSAWHYSCRLHVVVDVVIATKRVRSHSESMITVTTTYIVVRNAWYGY